VSNSLLICFEVRMWHFCDLPPRSNWARKDLQCGHCPAVSWQSRLRVPRPRDAHSPRHS